MSLEWVKLDASKLHEVVVSNKDADVRRAFCLLAYCAKMENAGVVMGAASWNRVKWSRLIGCYPIKQGCNVDGLWHWEDENIVCDLYNVEAEQRAKTLRAKRAHAVGMRWGRGESRGYDKGNAHKIKPCKQNKTGIHPCNTPCNTEKNRIENKEINKASKGDKVLLGIDSPEIRTEIDKMYAELKGRLSE